MTKHKDPARLQCPESKEKYSHHLVPKYLGRGQYELRCEYCKKSDKELREGQTDE